MMKRLTWFAGGVAAGVVGAGYAKRKVVSTASHLAPANVAKSAAGRAKGSARLVADAIREGRDAMNAREDELKARRDSRVASLDDHLDPGDKLLVDGQPIDSGRIIVLKEHIATPKQSRRRSSSRR